MSFNGFPKELITFLQNLERNNERAWFDEHRDEYERYYVEPARDFIETMGEKLVELAPINAIPKIDKSIFRINRDVRFSKDKRPYKTHLALWFWEGGMKNRMHYPGFYMDIDTTRVLYGAGIYKFPKDVLKRYRSAIDSRNNAHELEQIIKTLSKTYNVRGQNYKRVPRGFDKDHEFGDLLRYDGLTAGYEESHPKELFSSKIIDRALNHYKAMVPLHRFLTKISD